MFTGLVEAIGTCSARSQTEPQAPCRLTIHSALPPESLSLGDSVALGGCCLTIVALDAAAGTFAVEATTETLARTGLGALQVGGRINLERALRFGDRLGGHLVSGHVDGCGHVVELQQRDSALYMRVAAPSALRRYLAPRGSVTVDGVSLTVTEVIDANFCVALIPHTLASTTLADRREGDLVHLEVDLLARYVDRLLHVPAGDDA